MTTYSVTDDSELSSAVSAAGAGDVIELATGSYGGVTVSSKNPASVLTIRAASGATVTTGALSISGSSNVTIEGLTVSVSAGADGGSVNGSCSDIIIKDCDFTAPTQSQYASGTAFEFASGSDSCSLIGCSIEHFEEGVLGYGSTNMTIRRCYFNQLGGDSIKEWGDGARIIDNWLDGDVYKVGGNHSDGMQCGNTTDDVIITGNIMIQIRSSNQGIYLDSAPSNQVFSNYLIEQNIIFCQLNNGIAMSSNKGHTATNFNIRHNTVGYLYEDADKKATYIGVSGATTYRNTQIHDAQDGGIRNGTLEMHAHTPDGTNGVNKYYASIDKTFGNLLTAADFAPVPGSLTDPATHGEDTYGAYELIQRWEAAGQWPPPEDESDPPAVISATIDGVPFVPALVGQ